MYKLDVCECMATMCALLTHSLFSPPLSREWWRLVGVTTSREGARELIVMLYLFNSTCR
jgi:hypothetical protein